jgi:hypothetical protein
MIPAGAVERGERKRTVDEVSKAGLGDVKTEGSRRPKQQHQNNRPNNTPSNPCDVRVGYLPFQNSLMNVHQEYSACELFSGESKTKLTQIN